MLVINLRSLKKWEEVTLDDWRGKAETTDAEQGKSDADERYAHLKDELMPDGRMKRIFRDRETGEIIERVEDQS